LRGRRRKAGSGTYLLLKGRRWTRGNSRAPYNSPFLREEVVMFIVTEAAGGYLTAVLDKTNISEGSAIRLVLEENTLTPQLDNARPGDETFDYEGRTVLMLDAQVSQVLDDSTLDVEATDEGPKLILLPLH
jgi:hypothetical protein